MATTTTIRQELSLAPDLRWAARLLPSLTDLAFVAPLAFIFLKLNGARTLLGDGDTGWHVRAGERILATGTVPRTDWFSYTQTGQPWFAWEWLWDLGAAWLHRQWGMAAVVLVSLFLISLTSALLYRLAWRSCGNPLVAIGVTLLATAASSIHWLARPHLVTLLFALVFYEILEKTRREGSLRLLVLLPALMVPWTNLHGGFLAGMVLTGTYAAGEFLAAALRRDGSLREGWMRMRPYGAATLGCAAATLVNPYFWRLHVHLYRYLTDPYHFDNIGEFLSLSFHNPAARYFEALLVAGVVAAVYAVRRRDFTSALLLLSWAHMALLSARNVPLFAIFAVPPAARLIEGALERGREADLAGWFRRLLAGVADLAGDIGAVERTSRVHLASAAAFALLVLALLRPLPFQKCRTDYDPKSYPARTIPVLQSFGPAARVYTDDEWGDYLIYRDIRVFVDGRSDFYGSTFGNRYLEAARGSYKWRRLFAEYGVDTALLPVGSPLACTLKEARDWRAVYDDGKAIVFRSTSAPDGEAGFEPAAAPGSNFSRDRAIAKTETGDGKITQSYARRPLK